MTGGRRVRPARGGLSIYRTIARLEPVPGRWGRSETRGSGERPAVEERRSPGRPAGSTGDQTRERVLAAAVEVFARHGLVGASVRDIAREARIRVSSLYHHFPSKEALYQAVQARVDDQLREMMLGVMARSPDLRTMTREVIGGIFDFFLANRAYARLNYRRGLDGTASFELETRMSDRWLGMAEASMKPAQVRGQMKGVDPALFIISLQALVHWHMVNDELYRRVLGKSLDDADTAQRTREHIIQIALRTLGLE